MIDSSFLKILQYFRLSRTPIFKTCIWDKTETNLPVGSHQRPPTEDDAFLDQPVRLDKKWTDVKIKLKDKSLKFRHFKRHTVLKERKHGLILSLVYI